MMGFENGKKVPTRNNLLAIQTPLENAGVIFLDENGGGVKLRSPQ
jgi:hypothetical protein